MTKVRSSPDSSSRVGPKQGEVLNKTGDYPEAVRVRINRESHGGGGIRASAGHSLRHGS